MSVTSNIASLTSSRNTIRNKMIAAGQAVATDKLSVLASNLNIGTDTTDANATSSDILIGKTAYVNGQKVTGTIDFATDSDIRNAIDNSRSNRYSISTNLTDTKSIISSKEISDIVANTFS